MVRDGADAPPHHEDPAAYSTISATALPQAVVSALPPRSLVRSVRSPRVRSIAATIEAAALFSPRCSSIIAPDQIMPMGLAMPCPTISGAEPCTGSNTDGKWPSGLILPEGAMPMVPVQAGPRSERISPNKLEPTTTSNQSGCSTKLAVRISMWYLSHFTAGYFFAIASTRSSQYGIVIEMPLDLVAEVRCFFGRDCARSKANFKIRSTPMRVITVCWVTNSRSVSGNMRPPTEEYSPSVFSRTTQKSISPGLRLASGDGTPGINRTGRKLTYWSNSRRNLISEPHKEI